MKPTVIAQPLDFDGVLARYGQDAEAALSLHTPEGMLGEMVRYHLETGGKRLRALLPVWVCHNLGGDTAAAVRVGAGFELLHNATLVHDDLQDGDTVRRGRPTVWRAFGDAQAINAGDALYFQGMLAILGHRHGSRLAELAASTLVRVIEGQTMEFQLQLPAGDARHLAPSLAAWDAMAGRKTAALFRGAVMAGTVAADADAEWVERAAAWGDSLGLMFQVQDDYLDLVADKGRERRGTDLQEGKLSFPVLWAVERAPRAASERLLQIVRTPRASTTDAMVDEGLALLDETGALRETARWLRERSARLLDDPLANALPGLVERILLPVAAHL
jgi:geranylgeranyl diphosphate synthase, type I